MKMTRQRLRVRLLLLFLLLSEPVTFCHHFLSVPGWCTLLLSSVEWFACLLTSLNFSYMLFDATHQNLSYRFYSVFIVCHFLCEVVQVPHLLLHPQARADVGQPPRHLIP